MIHDVEYSSLFFEEHRAWLRSLYGGRSGLIPARRARRTALGTLRRRIAQALRNRRPAAEETPVHPVGIA